MFARLGEWVSRHCYLTIAVWAGLALTLRLVAPAWDEITDDRDLAHLPARMPSVIGERLVEAAFPGNRTKSQIVLTIARAAEELLPGDSLVADALASQFHLLHGAGDAHRGEQWQQAAEQLQRDGRLQDAATAHEQAQTALNAALESLDEALRLHEDWPLALHNRAIVRRLLGQLELADQDEQAARHFAPELDKQAGQVLPAYAAELPLVAVWTRHNEVVGSKLRSEDRRAELVLLQLSNEFMATANIRVLERVEGEIEAVRREIPARDLEGLTIGISGTAAVGGDMLRAAAESVKNTELLTVLLVIGILLFVYRAPLLIVVPITTIALSLVVSTALLALLTQLNQSDGWEWWNFRVFKTTKIFIVVILYGSGTDFCLFLIARYRELLGQGLPGGQAMAEALGSVGGALSASAFTTILGLAMMFFAEFGKFRNSGPAIGLCLAVTLLACLTLAPALLQSFGRWLFWPFSPPAPRRALNRPAGQAAPSGFTAGVESKRWWRALARYVVLHPKRLLGGSLLALLPLAVVGLLYQYHVTFDLLSELPLDRPTRQGSELLRRHFPVGEAGPVIVLAHKLGAGFDDADRQRAARASAAIFELTQVLYEIPGVRAVRSLAEPLGDPPRRMSLVSREGRRKLFLREHSLTKSIFLGQAPGFQGDVTRFELVLNHDPFSLDAMQTLNRIDEFLATQTQQASSFWQGTRFVYAGTTAGIRDLRSVTATDTRRIQVLVVLAVAFVLWLLLRRPVVCLYLIASVLLTYLVTIGTAILVFGWAYAETFHGLDWKVPVFLFVILIAVGQDYNIYLVTRVFEEQRRRGPLAGLREALVQTGGIITSCGIIMAGTFVAMTSGSLRAIVELGFALSFGILLDTFVVRTLLVPAFLAIWTGRAAAKPR